MKPADPIRTVIFDVGGTILRVHPSVSLVYSGAAADHGLQVEPAQIEQGFRAAWKRSLERSRQRGYRTSDEILRGEWLEIVRESFGPAVPASKLPALFDDLYERFASAQYWRPVPGVRETLEYLRGAGIRLGVLSNWDSRLERMLRELGLDRAFDFFVVSYKEGFEKPDPSVFAAALRCSGAEPHRTLHVGDSYHADIVPARKLGLQTLWIAPGPERNAKLDGGPGVDSLPTEPATFWRDRVVSPGSNGPS